MSGRRPPTAPDAAGSRPPERDRAPRRLRWALRAYPHRVRATEGDVLLSLARDLLDEGGSSIDREALGLLRGGLVARAGVREPLRSLYDATGTELSSRT